MQKNVFATLIREVLLIGCDENGALLFEKARKCDINKQNEWRSQTKKVCY